MTGFKADDDGVVGVLLVFPPVKTDVLGKRCENGIKRLQEGNVYVKPAAAVFVQHEQSVEVYVLGYFMCKVDDLGAFEEGVLFLLGFVKCANLCVLGDLVHCVAIRDVLDPEDDFPVGAPFHVEVVAGFDGKEVLLVQLDGALPETVEGDWVGVDGGAVNGFFLPGQNFHRRILYVCYIIVAGGQRITATKNVAKNMTENKELKIRN